MSHSDLELIESLTKLDAAATPGEWRVIGGDVCEMFRGHLPNVLFEQGPFVTDNDADMIAAMRNGLPRLLELAREGFRAERATIARDEAITEGRRYKFLAEKYLAALKAEAIRQESYHEDKAPLAPGCFNDYDFGDSVTVRVGCREIDTQAGPLRELFAKEVKQ